MNNIKAIGFDLFNTLITVDLKALHEAMNRLILSLQQSGIAIETEAFEKAHGEAAQRFIKETRKDGRETHNRFWICSALQTMGFEIPPDDVRIEKAVDDYFSVFCGHCRPIPGTIEMLEALKDLFRLGLLSNFTHGPAAIRIIDQLGLAPFFDVILISDDLGYRKPHPIVFNRLLNQLDVQRECTLFVGDDSDADIDGARQSGLQPIWMTYVQDKKPTQSRGLLARSIEEPDSDVPRISNWKDLFAFLAID